VQYNIHLWSREPEWEDSVFLELQIMGAEMIMKWVISAILIFDLVRKIFCGSRCFVKLRAITKEWQLLRQ
jgi:hypothetical protein